MEPAKTVKITPVKTKKKVRYTSHPQKKNIFEHMAEGFGTSLTKSVRTRGSFFDKLRKVMLSLGLYAALGYIMGLIIDMFLQSPVAISNVFCLLMVGYWLITKGRRYVKE
jgi:hypothetical protein